MAKPAFNHCSGAYARFRPAYPEDVFVLIEQITGEAGPRHAADIGAGTGIFTRQLAQHGWDVVAVDPSLQMLTHLTPEHPTVKAGHVWRVRATAEATAIRDASMTLVTCAQSFHWFNPPRALAEFARILRPRAAVVLTWNNRLAKDRFVSRFETLIQQWNPSYRREYRTQDWACKVADTNLFTPLERHTTDWHWRLSQDAMVGFTQSVSYIRNVLPAENRSTFETKLRHLLEAHFGDGPVTVPMQTETWWAHRRDPR